MITTKEKPQIEKVGRENITPALEVAKKFVSSSLSRPILTMAHINTNGDIEATDSHRAIILKNIHTYQDDLMVNPKTLELFKGYQYPNFDHVMSKEKASIVRIFTKKEVKEMIELLKYFKKRKISRNNDVKVLINEKRITFSSFNVSMDLTFENEGEPFGNEIQECDFTVNAEYLIDSFESFYKFSISEEITCLFENPMRPIHFINEEMHMCVLPIRVY